MNRLEVRVIFIHIGYDQQVSRIFPLLQKQCFYTRSYRPLQFKLTDTPFQFQGENIILNVQVPIAEFDYCPALKWSLTIIWLIVLSTFNQIKKAQK